MWHDGKRRVVLHSFAPWYLRIFLPLHQSQVNPTSFPSPLLTTTSTCGNQSLRVVLKTGITRDGILRTNSFRSFPSPERLFNRIQPCCPYINPLSSKQERQVEPREAWLLAFHSAGRDNIDKRGGTRLRPPGRTPKSSRTSSSPPACGWYGSNEIGGGSWTRSKLDGTSSPCHDGYAPSACGQPQPS